MTHNQEQVLSSIWRPSKKEDGDRNYCLVVRLGSLDGRMKAHVRFQIERFFHEVENGQNMTLTFLKHTMFSIVPIIPFHLKMTHQRVIINGESESTTDSTYPISLASGAPWHTSTLLATAWAATWTWASVSTPCHWALDLETWRPSGNFTCILSSVFVAGWWRLPSWFDPPSIDSF